MGMLLGKPRLVMACLMVSLGLAPGASPCHCEELKTCMEPEGMPVMHTRRAGHYRSPFSAAYYTQWANYRARQAMYLEQFPSAPPVQVAPSYAPVIASQPNGQWMVEQVVMPAQPSHTGEVAATASRIETLPVQPRVDVAPKSMPLPASTHGSAEPMIVPTRGWSKTSVGSVDKTGSGDSKFQLRSDPSRSNDMEYIRALRSRWQTSESVPTVAASSQTASAKPVGSSSRQGKVESKAKSTSTKKTSTKQGQSSGDLTLFKMPKWTPLEGKDSAKASGDLGKPAPVKTSTSAKPWVPFSKVDPESVELIPVE